MGEREVARRPADGNAVRLQVAVGGLVLRGALSVVAAVEQDADGDPAVGVSGQGGVDLSVAVLVHDHVDPVAGMRDG